MTSVIIAAHNEESLIGATLDALLADSADDTPAIIVVPNGCTDSTAEVARQRHVRVVEVAAPGKAAALNAGDQEADSFPRIYLDADIIVPPGGVRTLVDALAATGALVAVPARRLVVQGRPWPVRAYFTINERLPVFQLGLFGRGLVAISEKGRSRFDRFPLVVADDLFLDSLYTDDERVVVPEVEVLVETPHTTRALVRRLIRVRRGNAAMREHVSLDGPYTVRRADRWAWLRDVVMKDLRLAPAGAVYAALSFWAAVWAQRGPRASLAWGRDESTRQRGAAREGLDQLGQDG
ncbi:MAG: glycosyltransferase [Acidobacteriota bacterium]|nr:glycosyltransferase [Acidobacteriota bacterium]